MTTLPDLGGPTRVPGLSEEEQIRAAKYLPRELPKRVFDEERFLFPESYGVNRVRLLVRDPEWIFAYWDVNASAVRDVGAVIGERALALSQLTLRIVDPVSGAVSDILLPPGARWWYVRADSSRRAYRAELGLTLPSGEYRPLAESNTVVTPRVGPSPERARRRTSDSAALELPLAAAEADRVSGGETTPWVQGVQGVQGAQGAVVGAASPESSTSAQKGGASDAFAAGSRPGVGGGGLRR